MQPNFISAETNTDKLYQLNGFLKRLAAEVDWEAFRSALSVLRKEQPKGGRPPFDVVLMFKIIVLKSQYNLSDEMTEFFIRVQKDLSGLSRSHALSHDSRCENDFGTL